MTRDPRVFAITRPDPARGDPQHPYMIDWSIQMQNYMKAQEIFLSKCTNF